MGSTQAEVTAEVVLNVLICDWWLLVMYISYQKTPKHLTKLFLHLAHIQCNNTNHILT